MAIEVVDPSRVTETIARAFHVAQSGTPGPVVIVFLEDLFYGNSDAAALAPRQKAITGPATSDKVTTLEMLWAAEKPLVIAGGRLHGMQALANFTKSMELFQLPVATSQRRFHVFYSRHPNAAGWLFNRAPKKLLKVFAETDLLIVIGERIGTSASQSYAFPRVPRPDQPMIHIWPDTQEVGRNYQPELGIGYDPHEFIRAMLEEAPNDIRVEHTSWIKRLNNVHKDIMQSKPVSANDEVIFGHVVSAIDKYMAEDAVVTCDAGNFSSWPSRIRNMGQNNIFIAGTVGAMGPGVPSGVAAGIAAPGRRIVAFVGDGRLLMTGNELATTIQYCVPIKFFFIQQQFIWYHSNAPSG